MSTHTHTHTRTHTHTIPTTIPLKKTLPWLFVPAIPRPPDTRSFTQTHNTLWKTKKLAREVQEANVTTVSISSKLDVFSPHSLEDTPAWLRFLCFLHPEAPRSGACWVPTRHQKDRVAACQALTFGNLGSRKKTHLCEIQV